MSNGAEIWLEEDRIKNILLLLHPADKSIPPPAFLNISGSLNEIRTAHIVGIFDAATMEATTRRKNGDWYCKGGEWHNRGDKCSHATLADKQAVQAKEQAYMACGQCNKGFVEHHREGNTVSMQLCKCQRGLWPESIPVEN